MNFENAKKSAEKSELVTYVVNKTNHDLKEYSMLFKSFDSKKDFYNYINTNKKFIKLNGISFIKKEFGINNIKKVNDSAVVEIWENDTLPYEIEKVIDKVLNRESKKEQIENKCLNNYKIIDTQTTGIDCEKNKIISVAIITIENSNIVKKNKIYINPKLSNEELNEYQKEQDFSGRSPYSISKIKLPGMIGCDLDFIDEKEAIKILYKELKDSIIVGHNLNFEIKMIKALFRRNHVKENLYPEKLIKKQICTLNYLKKKNIIKNNSLDGWIKHLNLNTYDRGAYHDPLKDSEILFNIINNIMK